MLVLAGVLLALRSGGEQRYYNEVIGQMLSFYLLAAMGFMLALRAGAIDLSVWAVAGLGGLAAVGAMHAGAGPGVGILFAVLAGSIIGAVHGLVVAGLRLPSPLVTLATGGVIVLSLWAGLGDRAIALPDGVMDAWLAWLPDAQFAGENPLMLSRPFLLRMLLVAGAYLLVMFVLWLVCQIVYRDHRLPSPRKALWVAMIASGALAGLAGAIWLLDYGQAPVPHRLIGDLRVPAAALLAGAMLYHGRQRVLLSMLCLPAALLAATLWQLAIPLRPVWGYPLQMPLLIVMTLAAHAIIRRATKSSTSSPVLEVGDF